MGQVKRLIEPIGELTMECCDHAPGNRDTYFLCPACWSALKEAAPGMCGLYWKAWEKMVTAGTRDHPSFRAKQLEFQQVVSRCVDICANLESGPPMDHLSAEVVQ